MIFITLVLLIAVISVVICHMVAKRKGRGPIFWGVMGALFGPLAILVILLMGSKEEQP
ncbi:MAG: hypothetical protein GKR95_05220 [Gammaproteobacteria bacterium]|nr:hypothetical protein [Gammaproteobacteria bacterium]